MEFLTTPDIGAASRWTSSANPPPSSATAPSSVVRPTNALPPGAHPNALSNQNLSHLPSPSPVHRNAVATPQHSLHASTPYFANLDRAGIKNSFQSLFSPNPNVAATPAMLSRPAAAPGITPFISAMQTPGLVAPPTGVLPTYPPMRSPHSMPMSSPNHDAVLTTPYLREAAKEAVRREFMNMPTYVASNDHPNAAGERVVPGNEFSSPTRPPIQVMTKTGSTAPSPVHTSKVTPQTGDAKVPSSVSPRLASQGQKPSSPDHSKHPQTKDAQNQHSNQQFPVQPYFVQHAQPPPGMVMIGQHGMMMAPPPGAIYAPPPGVMMIPGGQPMMPQGMMMPAPHPVMRQAGPPVKPETTSERKARIEHEKQELIREFKKKTREAALVRFRQKRRERRFGKLIRYDCRKKLADARPRVKGRFVRIKADEDDVSEGPQVVPNLER